MSAIRRILPILLLLLVPIMAATAQVSAGIMLGEPTGLSAKLWTGEAAALDAALAWSFVQEGRFYLHVDYQQHFDLGQPDAGRLLFFGGLGGKLYLGEELALGARVPLGVLYELEPVPIELFLELAPGINIFPATVFDFGGGLGVRYRF